MPPNRKRILFFFIVGLTILIILRQIARVTDSQSSPSNTSSSSPFPVTHYRLADIQTGIDSFPPLVADSTAKRIRGGVVAHHLLAVNNIAKYFQNLSRSSYSRVILIGPNHGELGDNHLVTSVEDWDTPYGKVQADTILVKSLIEEGGAIEDNYILSSDHAIEVLVPFVKLYLPDIKIIPILVSAKTTKDEVDKLVVSLKDTQDSRTLYLVSSDFSHYLLPSVAKVKDEQTLSLIKSFNIDRISKLGNDHIDSGASLAILLRLMKELNSTELEVFDHADGSTIASQLSTPTTTYFFLNYYENLE